MGAERLMSGHGDVLIEFYECWLGIKLHPSVHAAAPRQLFPRSVKVHGWKTLMGQPDPEGLDIFAMVSKVAGSFEVSGCFS